MTATQPAAPTCPTCSEPYRVIVGLPVTVTFNASGTATITTDVSDLGSFADGEVLCGCEPTIPERRLPAVAEGYINDTLTWLAENTAPEVEFSV